MARKSKRLVINEAIRQGQKKIKEGLETGKMRSDGPSARMIGKEKKDFSGPENRMCSPIGSGQANLKGDRKSGNAGFLSGALNRVWLLGIIVVVLVVLGMVAVLKEPAATQPPVERVQKSESQVFVSQETSDREQIPAPEQLERVDETTILAPVVSEGKNVIVILTIQLNRKSELRPVADFFARKGIETEILEVSGKAALVTTVGFEQNPAGQGTPGYALFQRIKQLGTVYVKETEETKFGLKPFQDIYGYKRQ